MTDTTDAHDSVADDSQTRRRFLTAATSAVGMGGVAGVAVPFLGSWNPSEKAKAAGAPVRADISKLEPGQMVVIEWRGPSLLMSARTGAPAAFAFSEGFHDPRKGTATPATPPTPTADVAAVKKRRRVWPSSAVESCASVVSVMIETLPIYRVTCQYLQPPT